MIRHCTVKFLIVEPDGHWGVLALPLLCPDNSNYLGSGAQPKMDDLVVVSPPVDSFKTGQHKGGTDSLLDVICSTKSLADGRFSQSDVHHQSGSKSYTNIVTMLDAFSIRLDEFSKYDTSGMISDDIDAANSSEGSIDSSKAQKNAKKNARRKARKKAKRKNKHLSDTGSTEPEILSEESALGSSTSETSFNHDMDHGEGLVSHESIPVNSSPDCLISVNDSEGESNGITNCSESSETCTSDTDGIDVSEDTVTSVIHNFTGKYPAFNSEDGIQTKDMGFSISKGLEGKHGETIHSCDDISSNVFPDMPDSLVLGSVSVGCSSEDSTNARYDSNTAMMVSSNSDAPARINIQEKELSVFPVLWNGQKGSGSVAQSYSQNDCPEPELQTSGVEDVASELVHSLQDCTGNLEPPERCSAMSNTKDLITEDQNISILESLGYLNVPNLHEEQSAVHLHPLIGKEVAEVDNEVSLSEYSKEEHGSASVIRKWKPAEKKDNGFSSLGRLHISLQVHADEPAADGWSPKNSVEGKLSSNSQKHISSHKSEMCVDHRSGNVNGSSPEDKSPVQNICTPKQLNNKHPAVNCSTHTCKEKHIYAFGADSSKISGALHEAYRVQQLSESVQLATGSPIADFERLLHAASPIICQSNSVKICQSCLRDEVGGHLCPHKASNITLRSLWKWYEKNGSYGLEVRLEDYEYSKGLCFHHSAFQAYFVPYLSAVQLFKKPKNHCMNNVPVVSGACEVSKTLQSSSNIRHLPIFKVLIPRPHTKETSFSPLENQMCSSRASSMSQSADTTTDDLELLFEYFESDQPQLRKPLFEK